MAVKDTAVYLEECLESILRQSYTNWELIAVNDHSTDDSLEILNQYAARDKRIRVWQNEGTKLIPALQTGLKNVTGRLINRMDSDDIMPDYKIKLLVTEWKKYGKGYVIAGGTKHFVDQGEVGNGFVRYERWLNDVARNQTHFQEIYQECVIPSHSWIIHHDDFIRVNAFNPLVYPEDYDLCFRFYKYGLKVIGLDAVLHFWRDRSDRISRTWECYQDNRYFELKLKYFYELDRDTSRPLVLWGAGRNGKDMAKFLLAKNESIHWVCDNENKIGKDVYGIRLNHFECIPSLARPQILVVVSTPYAKVEIKKTLAAWHKKAVEDYWFFI